MQVVCQPQSHVVDGLEKPLGQRVRRHVRQKQAAALHGVQLQRVHGLSLHLKFLQAFFKHVGELLGCLEV
jgi:predicted N-acyltransferase